MGDKLPSSATICSLQFSFARQVSTTGAWCSSRCPPRGSLSKLLKDLLKKEEPQDSPPDDLPGSWRGILIKIIWGAFTKMKFRVSAQCGSWEEKKKPLILSGGKPGTQRKFTAEARERRPSPRAGPAGSSENPGRHGCISPLSLGSVPPMRTDFRLGCAQGMNRSLACTLLEG